MMMMMIFCSIHIIKCRIIADLQTGKYKITDAHKLQLNTIHRSTKN